MSTEERLSEMVRQVNADPSFYGHYNFDRVVVALREVLRVCDEEGQDAGIHPHSIRTAIDTALA